MANLLDGFIQIISAIIPANRNKRAYVTEGRYIKDAFQVFTNPAELVDFYPLLLKRGNPVIIMDYPGLGQMSFYALNTDPTQLIDGVGNSIITLDNWNQFYGLIFTTNTGATLAYNYAPDILGGMPPYPYTLAYESYWVPVYDSTKGHKWMRIRSNDDDLNGDGIYDNWSRPLPVTQPFMAGDYIANVFKRQAVSETEHTVVGTMTNNSYYIVTAGNIDEDDGTTVKNYTTGSQFRYNSVFSYTFNSNATCQETASFIPRTLSSGAPNNVPEDVTGYVWPDTPPAGTDQLFKAIAQKSVYGSIKSEWTIFKIREDPNYIRFSNTATPIPDVYAGVDADANNGDPADIALEAAGWSKTYSGQYFMGTRKDDQNPSSPKYTAWLVEKIVDESGEYVDRVFKLVDRNIVDPDSPLAPTAPSGRDASQDGWSDGPQPETPALRLWFSESRKYFDGTLKTPWTKPQPYTGEDTLNDAIISSPGDDFHTDQLGAVVPASIELTGELWKGGSTDVWRVQGVSIVYLWERIFNNGIDNTQPTNNPADSFYYKYSDVSGTADAGGSSTVLIDAGGNFVSKGVAAGDKVWNYTDGSYATVVTVDSATQLTTTELTGGTDNTWATADQYILEVDGYWQDGQRVVITPAAVDGLAVFRCTQTWTFPNGQSITFVDEITINDISDGIDYRRLEIIQGHSGPLLYDAATKAFVPDTVTLKAIYGNLPSTTLYWYYWDVSGAQWVAIDGTEQEYDLAANTLIVYPSAPADVTGTADAGGSATTLIDAAATFLSAGIAVGDPARNSTDGSVAVVASVDSDTQITTSALSGGGANTWASADSYAIDISLFTDDDTVQKTKYAVSTSAVSPDLADFDTIFSDIFTVTKAGMAQSGSAGVSPVLTRLTNESYTAVLNADQSASNYGMPVSGEIGAAGHAYTLIEVWKNGAKLAYGADYTVSIDGGEVTGSADTGGSSTSLLDAGAAFDTKNIQVGDIARNLTDGSYATVVTVAASQIITTALSGGTNNSWGNGDSYSIKSVFFVLTSSGSDGKIYVNGWYNPGTIVRTGICNATVSVIATGEVMPITFTVSSTLDAPGAIFVEVDPGQYIFTISNRTDIVTQTAKVYVNGLLYSPVTGAATGGGTGTSLQKATGSFLSDDIKPGDRARNLTDNSIAEIVSVNSNSQITTTALSGGSDNTWQSGDSFAIDRFQIRWKKQAGAVTIKTGYISDGYDALTTSSEDTAAEVVVEGGEDLVAELWNKDISVLVNFDSFRVEDMTDTKTYRLYYYYGAIPTVEPYAAPTRPPNTTVRRFAPKTGTSKAPSSATLLTDTAADFTNVIYGIQVGDYAWNSAGNIEKPITLINSATQLTTSSIAPSDWSNGETYEIAQYPKRPTNPGVSSEWIRDASDPADAEVGSHVYWAVDATETVDSGGSRILTWGTPYRILNEKGVQGEHGDYFQPMYNANGSYTNMPPFGSGGNTSTLAEMKAATPSGWVCKIPPNPASGVVWMTHRIWKGEDPDTVSGYVEFDANLEPSNADTYPGGGVVGSVWSTPVLLTGKPGSTGSPGNTGINGWTPILAVASDGSRRVLQVIDWTGGMGTKPNTGLYVGPSGLVSSISNGVDIRGSAGATGATGATGPAGPAGPSATWITGWTRCPNRNGLSDSQCYLWVRKDSLGRIYLAGKVNTSATGGYDYATVPAGFRPAHYLQRAIAVNGYTVAHFMGGSNANHAFVGLSIEPSGGGIFLKPTMLNLGSWTQVVYMDIQIDYLESGSWPSY